MLITVLALFYLEQCIFLLWPGVRASQTIKLEANLYVYNKKLDSQRVLLERPALTGSRDFQYYFSTKLHNPIKPEFISFQYLLRSDG